MCQYRYEYEGHRSYGPSIPDSCQGCYFPGDEPETRCRLTDSACLNQDDKTPWDCDAAIKTGWPCPDCASGYEIHHLGLNPVEDEFFCRVCHARFRRDELPEAYQRAFRELNDEIDGLVKKRVA